MISKKINEKRNYVSLVVAGMVLMILAIGPAMAETHLGIVTPGSDVPVAKGKTINISIMLYPEGVGTALLQSSLGYDKNVISISAVKGRGPFDIRNTNFMHFFNMYGNEFAAVTVGESNAVITSSSSSEIMELQIKGENVGQTTLSLYGIRVWGIGDIYLGNMLQRNLSDVSIVVNVFDDNDPYGNISLSEYYIYLKDETTGGIYFYENGMRRGFGSQESYLQRNPNNTGIIVMTSAQINAIPEGHSIHVFGTSNDIILEGSAGMPKYRMRDGYRRPISNWSDYLAKGWGGYNRSVLDIEVASIPIGAPI